MGAGADYRLRKELWCFTENRISVRFEYESHDTDGQWWRSHGNEHWEFDELGYMRRRDASINDYRIDEGDRRITWTATERRRGSLGSVANVSIAGPYALRTLVELGPSAAAAQLPIGELARRRDIPVEFLEQLFAVLAGPGS